MYCLVHVFLRLKVLKKSFYSTAFNLPSIHVYSTRINSLKTAQLKSTANIMC